MKKLISLLLLLSLSANAGLPPTATKGQTDSSNTTTFFQSFPDQTVYHNGVTSTITRNGRKTKNYIQYADIENNATTGWSLGTIGTLTNGLPIGTPTFGSGAAGTLSITSTNSNPIAGSYSLSYASTGATTAGNMVASQAYTIDAADQAKVLTVQFYYSTSSGSSNVNYSGTSSNSFAWAAWDVTNSVWLTSTGNFCMTQSSGVGTCTGTFQTGASTSQIRLVFYNVNATAGAATILLDDFYVGPQTAPQGPVITDWVSYTPTFTGFGTPTNVAASSRRVGGNLEAFISFTSGTTTATQAQITLGYQGGNANVTIDTSKLSTNNNSIIGYIGTSANSSAQFQPIASSSNQNYFMIGEQFTGTAMLTPVNANGFVSSGNNVTIHVEVPIVGWSSGSTMSSDSDTRVVAFEATTSTTAASTSTPFVFSSVSQDTHGAYNASNGRYTIPVTGTYFIFGEVYVGATATTAYVYKNGVNAAQGTTVSGSNTASSVVTVLNLVAGDIIDIRPDTSATASGGAVLNRLNIFRLSGAAIIAATETVRARYHATASTTVAASGVTTDINFDTKDYDSHNAVTTGASWKFTAPVSGAYSIKASVGLDTPGASFIQRLLIYKNGSGTAYSFTEHATQATGEAAYMTLPDSIFLNAGDYIEIRASNSNSSTTTTTSTNAVQSVYVAIERVGN